MNKIDKIGAIAYIVIPILAIIYAIVFNRMPHRQTAEEY